MQSPPKPAAAHADDDALLAAVARSDRTSFEELYRRHESDIFNLALHITGRRDLAEEAVQKAMLDVWRSAGSYRPGQARSWLLRVTANAALQALRSQRRRRREMNTETAEELILPKASAGHDAERSELLGALRSCLSALPELNRTLVALYYGAGLTQQEIGHEMAMPTRTVSFKLEETLKQLRARLAQGGFAAAAPLLSGEGLREAICGGEAPPALGAQVLETIARAARYSRRAAAQSAKTSVLWPALAMAAVAGVMGFWLLSTPEAPPPKRSVPEEPIALPLPEVSPEPPAAAQEGKAPEPLSAQWDFRKGPPQDLPLLRGCWTWRQERGQFGMAVDVTAERDDLRLILPLKLPAKPFVIELTGTAVKGTLHWNAEWIDEDGFIEYETWKINLPTIKTPVNRFQFYVLGEYTISRRNGMMHVVHRYKKPYPSDRMCLQFVKWVLHDMEVRELAPNDPELPALDPRQEIERIMKAGGIYGPTPRAPLDRERPADLK